MFKAVAAMILFVSFAVLGLAGEPAAVVNGEEITHDELEAATNINQLVFGIYQQFPSFAQTLLGTEEGTELLERYQKDVLDDLIERKLLEQEAERRDLTADEDEVQEYVDHTIENVKQQHQMTQEELVAALAQQNTTLEEFREEIAVDVREHLVREALIDDVIAEVTVSEDEVQTFYEENPEQFRDQEGERIPLEEVEDAIAEELESQAQERAWQDWLGTLREDAEITVNL